MRHCFVIIYPPSTGQEWTPCEKDGEVQGDRPLGLSLRWPAAGGLVALALPSCMFIGGPQCSVWVAVSIKVKWLRVSLVRTRRCLPGSSCVLWKARPWLATAPWIAPVKVTFWLAWCLTPAVPDPKHTHRLRRGRVSRIWSMLHPSPTSFSAPSLEHSSSH